MILIFGGNGCLGESLIQTLKEKSNFKIISVDLNENKKADFNILIKLKNNIEEEFKIVEKGLLEIIKDEKIKHIINIAGGWAGGSISSPKLFENVEKMWSSSVQTSVLAGHLASKYMDRYLYITYKEMVF